MRILYWFKRDLRLKDNRGFAEACKKSEEVIPVFVFDQKLLQELDGPASRTGFLLDALRQLNHQLAKKGSRLYCFYGEPEKIFARLLSELKPEALFTNQSYSWSGEERQKKIERLCRQHGLKFSSFNDTLLVSSDKVEARQVFNAFFRLWQKALAAEDLSVRPEPEKIYTPLLKLPELEETSVVLTQKTNHYWPADYAEKRLRKYDFRRYEAERNRLDLDGSSRLSVAIRFGLVSIRQVLNLAMKQLEPDSQFIKELAWREFWYHLKYHFPWTRDLEFQEKRRGLKWLNREENIRALEEARTGYPIIDAAIRQLQEEGWMHNRARLVVASFVTKDLLVDWRIGEKFFKKYLLDYDEVVNTGNWQWSASVGADPRPFRMFNPVIQAQKFDPHCRYIKKYLPELKKLSCRQIHSLELPGYYPPVVDHRAAAIRARQVYLNRAWKK